jgi:hypothetical protein
MKKKNDRWDAIAASASLDTTAAKVVARGTHYEPKINYANHEHWDSPPPMKPLPADANCPDLRGAKFGRFIVIGLGDTKRGSGSAGASWVVRCACGDYEHRTKKAILNPRNIEDKCRNCRDWEVKKKRYDRLGSKPLRAFIGDD